MAEHEIPLAPIDRIIHKAGATRVSDEAVRALRDLIEAVAIEIAREAVEACKHAGRKTVSREDVEFAVRRLYRPPGIFERKV